METFIFNTFKDNLLKGNIKGIADWRIMFINSNIDKLKENEFKSIENIKDLNLLILKNDNKLKPSNKGWLQYFPSSSESETKDIHPTYLADVNSVIYTYAVTKNTLTSDKPLFVDSNNIDLFLDKYKNNKHLKKLFMYPPIPPTDPTDLTEDEWTWQNSNTKYKEKFESQLKDDGITDLTDPEIGQFFRYSSNVTDAVEFKARGFYYVKTVEELKWCAEKVNGDNNLIFNNRINIVLGDNIGVDINSTAISNKLKYCKEIDFVIGSKQNRPYNGIFYGNGFKIQNIDIRCSGNNNGIIGTLGIDGVVDSVRFAGIAILRNRKKLNIAHMTTDGCDINAGVLCGKNYGTINKVYMDNGRVYIKGFSPEVYTVSNRSDTQDSTAFMYPQTNVFYPSYLCINSKANIIPYIGYFAEGVHSSVMNHNYKDTKPNERLAYWNAYTTLPSRGFKPYDTAADHEWAYPSGTTNSATDITAHVLYYDLTTMKTTQGMVTEKESDWTSYLSMLPYSSYEVDNKDDSEKIKRYWNVSATQYSDKSIKMHQFNRVSYNVGVLVGCNHSNIYNSRVEAKSIFGRTFVGFLGGLAGKQAPHRYTSIINCGVNLSATDDYTRDYYDSLETEGMYDPIPVSNKVNVATYGFGHSPDFYNNPKDDISYPYRKEKPFLQIGLRNAKVLGWNLKTIPEFKDYTTTYKDLFEYDGKKFETKFNYVIDDFKELKSTTQKIELCPINATVALNARKSADLDVVDAAIMNNLPTGFSVDQYDYTIKDDKLVIKDFSFTTRCFQDVMFTKDVNKLVTEYLQLDSFFTEYGNEYIYWFAGKIGKLTLKLAGNDIGNSSSCITAYNMYTIDSAQSVKFYGIKITQDQHSILHSSNKDREKQLEKIIFLDQKLDKYTVFCECTFNDQIKWSADIKSKDHKRCPYIGPSYTDKNYGDTTKNKNALLFTIATTAKKKIGCKNYHIEKKSIKNVGALFGNWVIGGNSSLFDVSAYLYNENCYKFNNSSDWLYKPYSLQDYAFNNRFSSLAAICEYQTDCIGDILPEMEVDDIQKGWTSKPVTFKHVHLHYDEPESQKPNNDSKKYIETYPMYLMKHIHLEVQKDYDGAHSWSLPFGIANHFIAEIKPNYLAIPTIIESPLSNFSDLNVEPSAVTNSMRYKRIGLFTMDQNLASPTNDSVFWSINANVDLPGDYVDPENKKYGDNIATVKYNDSNKSSLIELSFSGLSSIVLGKGKSEVGFNGIHNGLWTMFPKNYYVYQDVKHNYPEFSGNKLPAANMIFGSDIKLLRYQIPYSKYKDLGKNLGVIPYDTVIEESMGDFTNYFGYIHPDVSVKTEDNKKFNFALSAIYGDSPKTFKENMALSEADDNANNVFKYTYTTAIGEIERPVLMNNVMLSETSNNKFGFRFLDPINIDNSNKKDGNLFFNDDFVYDGSIMHLGLVVNEECVLHNLRKYQSFEVSSISADDLAGLLIVENELNTPIMYIDTSNYKFDGTNSYNLNLSPEMSNIYSSCSAKLDKLTNNYGLIMEIE